MNPNWACLCKEIYQSFSLCRKRFRKDHCEIYQCPSRFNKVHHLLHGTAFLFLSGFLWKSMVRIIHFHRGSWNVILSSRLFPVKRFVKIPSCELISQSPSWDSQTSIQMLELKPIFHWCLFSVKRFSKVHRDIFYQWSRFMRAHHVLNCIPVLVRIFMKLVPCEEIQKSPSCNLCEPICTFQNFFFVKRFRSDHRHIDGSPSRY